MADSMKAKRTNSTKLKGILENTLKLPGRSDKKKEEFCMSREEDLNPDDSAAPDILPILRRSSSRRKKEKDIAKEPAKMISTEGMMKYDDMMSILKCRHCGEITSPPLVQCRKGHVYCRTCKVDNKIIQCNTCKQTFVDAPNLALDQLIRMIAIPCKYGNRGCLEYVFLDSRLQHETLCKYRPVHCQYEKHGCTSVFSMKDMCWHHKMCEYANYPHPNVLPSMPTRKKGQKSGTDPAEELGNGSVTTANLNNSVSVNSISQQQLVDPVSPVDQAVDLMTDLARPSVEVQTEIKLFPGVLSIK